MQAMFLAADMHNIDVFLHAGIDAANVHSIFEEHYVAPTLDDAVVPWIFHLGIPRALTISGAGLVGDFVGVMPNMGQCGTCLYCSFNLIFLYTMYGFFNLYSSYMYLNIYIHTHGTYTVLKLDTPMCY